MILALYSCLILILINLIITLLLKSMKSIHFSSEPPIKKKVWVAPSLEHIEIKSKILAGFNLLGPHDIAS